MEQKILLSTNFTGLEKESSESIAAGIIASTLLALFEILCVLVIRIFSHTYINN